MKSSTMKQQCKIYLIYSPGVEQRLQEVLDDELINRLAIQIRKVKLADMTAIHVDNTLAHALVWVEPHYYPQVLAFAYQKQMSLGFLATPGAEQSRFLRNLELPTSLPEQIAVALHEEPFVMDLIQCNGEIVTEGVYLENQTAMAEFIGDSVGFNKFHFLVKRFFHAFSLTPHPVTLTTAKGKKMTTAITGMALLDFHKSGLIPKLFQDSISLRDKRISVVLFAPQSILSYLQQSSPAYLSKSTASSYQQLGYIRTESLTIQSPVATHYLINDKPATSAALKLETLADGIRINAGVAFRERQFFHDDKENVICDQLPQQEDRIKYLSKTLPFFSHALESDFKDLFLNLKESARGGSTFILLMVLSSMLATLGLFLNSPSVVIGAMVLAPLMAPIISLSMGVLRSNAELTRQSFLTLLIGILIALGLAALMANLMPFQTLTSEIEGRLHPSTLDLLVAVISGVAGAFANARENVAKSLPGVAIAVALVPPLCVSGIGLGWMNIEVFSGAMLLFLTNLTGIIMAAGLAFMIMGFAPVSRARKGIVFSILMVIGVSVPLYYSFNDMRQRAAIQQLLRKQTHYDVAGQTIKLEDIKVRTIMPLRISADLYSLQMPEPLIIATLEKQLSERIQQQLKAQFSIHLVSGF